jgi:outer membrane protein
MSASIRWAMLAGAMLIATPALAEQSLSQVDCVDGKCTLHLTAAQLLDRAQRLVFERRFGEAAPMLAALENAPEFTMERQFLTGYVAVESGDLKTAVSEFRAVLAKHPDQTRVRLELARALMLQGKNGAADHHFRLAQGDDNLPLEVLTSIRISRTILRSQRQWSFNVDFGIAPDSNITNGTNADSIGIKFGDQTVPLTLDANAKAKTGTGQTAGFSGAARLNLGDTTKLLIEGDTQIVNYKGNDHDDISAQLAVGPEFQLSERTRLSVQAVGSQRWYGGRSANLAGGIRATGQHTIGQNQRIEFSLDARNTHSGFLREYSGWQIGATASYERVFAHSMIASASLFARRDALNAAAYSGIEFGANLGIGGELPYGITAGVSAGVSRAIYDAAVPIFGGNPRGDWRFNGRVQLGLRTIRLLGFSPSISYSVSSNKSSLALYDSDRQRFRFAVAHYF